YIYLLARTSFVEQSLNLAQASRMMGCSPWQSFWRLSLPMARPALAVGVALVAMETAADFATVSYFALPTLTTAVYDTWLGYGNLTAAAKLSAIILLVVFLLIGIERFERRKQQLFQKAAAQRPEDLYRLTPMQTFLALGFCGALLCLAFVLPFGMLLSYAVNYFGQSWDARFWQLSVNSLSLALITSVICLSLALLLMFVRRISPRASDALPARLATLGYALPGTVLAIGVLIPLTWLDFGLNDLADSLGLKGPGLIFSGSVAALIFAFCVRFVAIAIGSVENSYKRISPSLDRVSVTLGQRPWQLFTRVHLPLLAKGLFAGALLVFIESMKELPAALLLRPVGFENLATFAFQYVSDEKLEHGALAAIVIVVAGLVPLIYLNRSLEQHP
ncbi:MAG: ABC transporter permease, partial [Shewanella sp.]